MGLILPLGAFMPTHLRMTFSKRDSWAKGNESLQDGEDSIPNCFPENDVIGLYFLEVNLFFHTLFANLLDQK